MLPARFAPGAIRTRDLSLRRRTLYPAELRERKSIFDFRFADFAIVQRLGIVADQRAHVVAFEFFASAEKIKLDDEKQTDDFAAETFDQIERRARRSARRQQIIDNQDAMTFADGVTVYFERVLPVFQIVGNGNFFRRKLFRLADGNETGIQMICQRRGENKSARFDADDRVNLLAFIPVRRARQSSAAIRQRLSKAS